MDSSETPSDDEGCNAPYEETEVADNVADTPRVFLTLGVRPCGAFSQDLDVDGGLGDNPRKSLPDIKPCVCMLPTPPLDFVMVLKSNFIQMILATRQKRKMLILILMLTMRSKISYL